MNIVYQINYNLREIWCVNIDRIRLIQGRVK